MSFAQTWFLYYFALRQSNSLATCALNQIYSTEIDYSN